MNIGIELCTVGTTATVVSRVAGRGSRVAGRAHDGRESDRTPGPPAKPASSLTVISGFSGEKTPQPRELNRLFTSATMGASVVIGGAPDVIAGSYILNYNQQTII